MKRKQIIKLADLIRDSKPMTGGKHHSNMQSYVNGKLDEWRLLRDQLADLLQAENPGFRRGKWLDYIDGLCGPCGGRVTRSAGSRPPTTCGAASRPVCLP